MRIGIDIRSLQNDSGLRGIGTYTRELVKALLARDSGHEYVFFAFANRPLPSFLPPDNVRRVTSLKKRFVWLLGQALFPLAAAKERLDVFYSPEYIVPVFAPCAKVITVHDFINSDYPVYKQRSGILRRAYFYLKDKTLLSADRIIAVSEYTKRKIGEFSRVDQGKVRVIHEAAGREFAPDPDPARAALIKAKYCLGEKFVLYVGAIDYHKNIDGLIRAFAAAGRGRAQLALAGVHNDLVYSRYVRELAHRCGAADRIRFLGYVPQEDLVGLYNAAAVFVSVSAYEGFGLPVLEAMSCATPVICADNTSMPEIAGNAGVLVDPHNTQAIAGAMERLLLDDAERAKLSRSALARSREFSWEKAGRRTLDLFEELTR